MASTPTREVARRVFAREFNDASFTFKESDDERAPVYLLLPTGERANRVFVVGTLTETEDVGEDSEYWQGRIVDPNGDTFFTYAGQYQPDAASALRELEPPAYVSVVGKPRTFETDDGEVNVSVRPESITEVTEAERDRWVVETAERTLDRIQAFEDGGEYVEMAREQYGGSVDAYKQAAIEALESLDGERETEAEPEAGV
jgi:RPA family protein